MHVQLLALAPTVPLHLLLDEEEYHHLVLNLIKAGRRCLVQGVREGLATVTYLMWTVPFCDSGLYRRLVGCACAWSRCCGA